MSWDYPHRAYSYKKFPGWYPSVSGGWARCIEKVYLDEQGVIDICPDDCEVVELRIIFREIPSYGLRTKQKGGEE